MIDLDEPVYLIDMTQADPSSSNCILFKGYRLDSVKVESL